MKKKVRISVAIDPELNEAMEERVYNKSKYIENLIYQDIAKVSDKVKNIIL